MVMIEKLLKTITDSQIASAAIYPTSSYTGKLPSKTVKKGSKGADVKAVQKFLNWCIKAGLAVDGSCGKKTVAAIKKYQKQYGLKVDGIFGSQSKKKAEAIIKKYAKPKDSTPAKSNLPEWVRKANAWAIMIANDNDFHYNKWSGKIKDTQTCPICTRRVILNAKWDATNGVYHLINTQIRSKARYVGWNCIGFAWAIWHHGAGIDCRCNCHVIANGVGERIYKAKTPNEATSIAQNHAGIKKIKVIRNKNGIPKSQWKPGDICLQFSGSKYVHTFYYMGNEKIADSIGSSGKIANNKQIAIRNYKNYSAKIIIRYTGE